MQKSKRLFNPIKIKLVESLQYLLENRSAASKVINYTFKNNKKWGSRDRRSFAEAFYSIIRNLGLYQSLLGYGKLSIKDVSPDDLRKIVNLYEQGVQIHENKPFKGGEDLEFTVSQDLLAQVSKEFSIEEKAVFLKASLNTAEVFLRVNKLLISDKNCLSSLEDEGIQAEIIKDSCLRLKERQNVFVTQAFKKGYFEVQDGASQKVAPFMELEAGQRVADSCAGAGGKTLHISSVLGNKGKIVAMDIFPRRLEELKKRAKRAQAQNIEIKSIESTKAIKRMAGKFDRVLLDVPCTGTGTYRRKPESRIFFTSQMHESLLDTQRDVLRLHSTLVKDGGLLIYSTCSVLPSENREQVDLFLSENSNFKFIEDDLNKVGQSGFDGFYMAKLKKESVS